jgi:hypothetical protein
MRASFAAFFLAALGMSCQVGCGTSCAAITEHEDTFRRATASVDDAHAVFWLPAGLLEEAAQSQLEALAPIEVSNGGLGPLSPYAESLAWKLQKVALVPVDSGVGVRLGMELRYGGKGFATAAGVVRMRPRIDAAAHDLVLQVEPEDLRAVEVELLPGSAEALEKAIRAAVPSAMRGLIPAEALRNGANTLLKRALGEGWKLAQQALAGMKRPLVSTRVHLGDLPLRAASWSLDGEHLRTDVVTSLPVARGVSGDAEPPASAKRARVLLAGNTVAALANEGIRRGMIPLRYSKAGKPDATGSFTAALDWQNSDRPLMVHAWQTTGTCLHAVLEGKPTLVAKSGALQVGMADGRIASVDGPPLVELGSWLGLLGGDAFEHTADVMGETTIGLADRLVRLEVVEAKAAAEGVELDMSLDVTKSKPSKKRKK